MQNVNTIKVDEVCRYKNRFEQLVILSCVNL